MMATAHPRRNRMPPATLTAPPPPLKRAGEAPKSAIIIGAGPGGLAAAMLLAKAGVSVRVVERLPSVGGRCSAIQEQGYRFDPRANIFPLPTGPGTHLQDVRPRPDARRADGAA